MPERHSLEMDLETASATEVLKTTVLQRKVLKTFSSALIFFNKRLAFPWNTKILFN